MIPVLQIFTVLEAVLTFKYCYHSHSTASREEQLKRVRHLGDRLCQDVLLG